MNLHFESFALALQVHAYGSVFTLDMTHWSPQKSISIWECQSISLVLSASSVIAQYLIAVMQNRTCKSSQHGKKQGTIVEVKIGNKTYRFHPDQQDPASLVSCLSPCSWHYIQFGFEHETFQINSTFVLYWHIIYKKGKT